MADKPKKFNIKVSKRLTDSGFVDEIHIRDSETGKTLHTHVVTGETPAEAEAKWQDGTYAVPKK